MPENPVAWLYTVAKNKATDYFRRNALFKNKISEEIKLRGNLSEEIEIDLSGDNIRDSQLQMMFAICHPVINAEAQIGLSLRILCGFGIEEIANAFLSNKETINKRLLRAKDKLRREKVKIEFPSTGEINNRLETVLTTLYLLFNEGYYSASQDIAVRKDLCLEAMRLTLLLTENDISNLPPVNALLSLMCFHASRFDARIDSKGELILYEEQDSSLWDQEIISRGEFYLNKASHGITLSRYHLEAAIAYWHTKKEDSVEKWENILHLYNQLLIISYSPVAALNRTYALSKAKGKKEAIAEAEKLGLDSSHLYHSLLGNLYTDFDNKKAVNHLKIALSLSKTKSDKKIIENKISLLQGF